MWAEKQGSMGLISKPYDSMEIQEQLNRFA
jgi:hypothetical protein